MSDQDVKQLIDEEIEGSGKLLGTKNEAFIEDTSTHRLAPIIKPKVRTRLKKIKRDEAETNFQHKEEEKIALTESPRKEVTFERSEIESTLNEQTSGDESELKQEEKDVSATQESSFAAKKARVLSGLKKFGNKNIRARKNKRKDSKSIEVKEEEEQSRQEYQPNDSELIVNVTIHEVENIKSGRKILHPVVQVHVIDTNSGKYMSKRSLNRKVTFYYENDRDGQMTDYVLPVITKPCALNLGGKRFIWDDVITYDEDYNYFIQPEIVFFFEILDFVTPTQQSIDPKTCWYRIGWAFLRPVSVAGGDVLHTERKMRLQLFKAISNTVTNMHHLCTTELFDWWKHKKKIAIQGSLFVTIQSFAKIQNNLMPTLRSVLPFQPEQSLKAGIETIEHKQSEVEEGEDNMKETSDTEKETEKLLLWDRIEGQNCKLPKSRWHSLNTQGRGCFSIKFSNDGRKLACASPINASNEYFIFIYEIPSAKLLNQIGHHSGIIYELDWSNDDKWLLSSSNDCTAKAWKLSVDCIECIKCEILPHPCFLYCAKFHPNNLSTIVTGGFDGVIRVWTISVRGREEPQLVQEICAHKEAILCFCYNYYIEHDQHSKEVQMFTAANDGTIKVFHLNRSEVKMISQINIKEIKNIAINAIVTHPSGNKLLLFCRDGIQRLIDYKLEIIIQQYKGSLNFHHFIRGCLSPCGQLVFNGSEDGSVIAWNTDSGARIHTYLGSKFVGAATCVEYHPFDHILAFCGLGSNTCVHLFKYTHESGKHMLSPIDKNKLGSKIRLEKAINMLDSMMINRRVSLE